MSSPTPYVREPGYARRYRDVRFDTGSGPETDRRERDALRLLLADVGQVGPWLDAPSGAGRMSELLPAPVVQADRDAAMLVAARERADRGPRVAALVHRLPFADRTFAGVLCMRLLHHIPTSEERIEILRELRRVSRGPLVASYFDAFALQHVRRVIRRHLGKTRSGRHAIRGSRFDRDLRAAGWRPRRRVYLRRFVSEQVIVLAEPA